MKKRFLSLLLALALCLTLPLFAAAEGGSCAHESVSETGFCSGCNTQMAVGLEKMGDAKSFTWYETFSAALAALNSLDASTEATYSLVLADDVSETAATLTLPAKV